MSIDQDNTPECVAPRLLGILASPNHGFEELGITPVFDCVAAQLQKKKGLAWDLKGCSGYNFCKAGTDPDGKNFMEIAGFYTIPKQGSFVCYSKSFSSGQGMVAVLPIAEFTKIAYDVLQNKRNHSKKARDLTSWDEPAVELHEVFAAQSAMQGPCTPKMPQAKTTTSENIFD